MSNNYQLFSLKIHLCLHVFNRAFQSTLNSRFTSQTKINGTSAILINLPPLLIDGAFCCKTFQDGNFKVLHPEMKMKKTKQF